jgi:hypothetical protein
VAGRSTSDDQGWRGYLSQPFPPRRVRAVELGANGWNDRPVERQRCRWALGCGPLSREGRRRVFKNEPAYPAGLLLGDQVGDHASHRVAHERELRQVKLVEDAHDVIAHQLE